MQTKFPAVGQVVSQLLLQIVIAKLRRKPFVTAMAKKKPTERTATISFTTVKEKLAAVAKSKVRHASLSHCARDLFKTYKP